MPFSFVATRCVFSHRLLGMRRLLLRQPRTLFVDRYSAVNRTMEPVKHEFPWDKNCPICGFAMVRLQLSGSWTVETCSAYSLKSILDRPSLPAWVQSLEENHSINRDENKVVIPNLPTPGH